MNNFTSPRYWRHYNALPPEIQKVADKNFRLFKKNPQYPSLRFEREKTGVVVGLRWWWISCFGTTTWR
jgi:hypothetical protein